MIFRRNLCASPLCSCGSIENTEHYLLHCFKYNDIRRTTIHTLTDYTDINIALLLYGLPDQIVMFLKWSMRLSLELKDLLRLIT